jgi:hypothetical protein
MTFAKSIKWLYAKFAISVFAYNFMKPFGILSKGEDSPKHVLTAQGRAAGITDNSWSYKELLALPNLC